MKKIFILLMVVLMLAGLTSISFARWNSDEQGNEYAYDQIEQGEEGPARDGSCND